MTRTLRRAVFATFLSAATSLSASSCSESTSPPLPGGFLRSGAVIHTGVTTDHPGWSMLDPGANQRSGFDIELADWLSSKLRIDQQYVDVTLEADAMILPGTHLEGRTSVGTGARIGPGCLLRDTSVAPDAMLLYTVCESAEIGPGATVGPFARLRPGTCPAVARGSGGDQKMSNVASNVSMSSLRLTNTVRRASRCGIGKRSS